MTYIIMINSNDIVQTGHIKQTPLNIQLPTRSINTDNCTFASVTDITQSRIEMPFRLCLSTYPSFIQIYQLNDFFLVFNQVRCRSNPISNESLTNIPINMIESCRVQDCLYLSDSFLLFNDKCLVTYKTWGHYIQLFCYGL